MESLIISVSYVLAIHKFPKIKDEREQAYTLYATIVHTHRSNQITIFEHFRPFQAAKSRSCHYFHFTATTLTFLLFLCGLSVRSGPIDA